MKKWAYYNDNDPYVAQWLRNLIAAKLIANGDVDERSIKEVKAEDVKGYTQCHFFAGIGGWSYALRLAGWPDSREVWTGSCPCQPFSEAGKQKANKDIRHLWPQFKKLINECTPTIVFGEQTSSALGRKWLSTVLVDLDALGFATGAADLPAACVGAPHKRNRLWFVADANSQRWKEVLSIRRSQEPMQASLHAVRRCTVIPKRPTRQNEQETTKCRPWKPESKIQRVVDGIPHRVSQLSAYGNAIVPQVAAQFVAAFMECRP